MRIPARDVLVATHVPRGSRLATPLPGRIAALVPTERGVLEIDCGGGILLARLTEAAIRDLALAPGREVFAVVKSAAFDPGGFGTTRPAVAI